MPTNDKVKEAFELIEQGVEDVYTSENYIQYLSFISKFHQYSLNNTLLIFAQYPTASIVAGYNSWKANFKRNVNKGAKAIKILAPYKVKVKKKEEDNNNEKNDNEVEITLTKFRIVNVFDVSQTSGAPLPELIHDLTGTSTSIKAMIESIKEACHIPIYFESETTDSLLSGGAKGYYNLGNDSVVINKDLEDKQIVKTLIHEYAHSLLHKEGNKAKEQKEIEAESLAFVICNHFGIDTSEYSFVYVASYANNDPEFLKETLMNIQNNAHEIISTLEPIYERNLKQMKEQDFMSADPEVIKDSYLTPVQLETISKGLIEDIFKGISKTDIYTILQSREAGVFDGKDLVKNFINENIDEYSYSHDLACYFYENNDYFKRKTISTIYLRCYYNIFDPNQDRPFIEDSIERDNYLLLQRIIKPFTDGDLDYVKMSTFSPSMMDLNIEKLYDDRIAISHYYELNGDMMADPDMEFIVDHKNQLLYPQHFQQDNMQIFHEVNDDPFMAHELNTFTDQWLNNVQKNGYRVQEMHNDDFSIKLNKSGKITESSGDIPKSVMNYIDYHKQPPVKNKSKPRER